MIARIRSWQLAVAAVVIAALAPASAQAVWSGPHDLSPRTGNARVARAVLDPAGDATAVWQQLDGGQRHLYAATRPAGGAWTPQHLLTRSNPTEPRRRARRHRDRRVEGGRRLGERIESASHEPGSGWSQTTVAASAVSNSPPHVALDRDGNAAVSYIRDVAGRFAVHLVERPAGGGWTAPAILSVPGRDAFEPRIAFDSQGRAVAVWRRKNDVNYIVQSVSRPRGGSWSEAANLSAPDTVARELSDLGVTFDADGDALVTWYRTDGTTFRIQYAVDDTHAPRLDDLVAPSAAEAGVAAVFSVAPWDAWSAVTTSWEFGDGAPAADPPRQQPAPPRPSVPAPPAARPVLCRVPQLAGLTLAQAKRRLEAAHCALGHIGYVSGRRNAGKVIRSSHRRGAAVAKGTRIGVTVVRRRRAAPQRRRAAVQSALRVQVPVEKPTS